MHGARYRGLVTPPQRAAHPPAPQRVLRYQHVYDLVVSLIEERGLKAGDRLPSTTELAELANVSIISVRRALDELDRNGKIVRHQGLGTFVAPDRIASHPQAPGTLLDTLRGQERGGEFETELVSLIVGTPSSQHAAALRIAEGTPVWEVWRRRMLGSTPKVLERAVLPLSIVPSLDDARLGEGGSLYTFLAERYGLVDEFVEQALEVDKPTPWEREHLAIEAGRDVVRIRGVSATADGVVFDCFQQTYPASDFVFYVSGTSERRLVDSTGDAPWTVRPLGGVASSG